MATCGADWLAEAEVSWRRLYQGKNSIETHLESVNIFCQSMGLDTNSADFRIVFQMSLLKEYQTILEHNFRFIKNSQATWPEISAWLCSVK